MSNVVTITEASDAAIVVTTDPTFAAAPSSVAAQISKNLADASQNLSITSIGFKPRLIIFCGGVNSGSVCIGFASLSGNTIFQPGVEIVQGGQVYSQPGNGVVLRDLTNPTSNVQVGNFISFDPLGFTIAWTKIGSPAATIVTFNVICFR